MLDNQFKNPKKLPLEELVLEVEREKIPALCEKWVETRNFTKYSPLVLNNGMINESFDEDDFLQNLRAFNKDLEWMLRLRFHRFWSHVQFDKEFLNPLMFFLQEATPFYIPIGKIFEENEEVVKLYEKVCRNALVIVCRLITNRESDEEFMSKEKQADIIYSNFIISIPMIFDLIALFGNSNKNLMQKIIDTLLKIEPKYSNDLKMGIKFIQSTFDTLRKQLEVIDAENRELAKNYEDISLYLMNIAITLNVIIDLVPNDVKSYCSRELHLESSIANFYENFIPSLYQFSLASNPGAWFLNYINYARVELINCYRSLLNRGISAVLNAGEKNRHKIADGVLLTLTETAGYKVFIEDYVRLYPIDIDLDVLSQCGKNVDNVKLDFVAEAFKTDTGSSKNVNNGYHLEQEQPVEDEEELGACALPQPEPFKKSAENIEETVQLETIKILELFPGTYGDGYIRRLLAFYDNSSETVISKILEGNLDPLLKDYDEQEPYIPPEVQDKVFLATGLERSNIHDGDKFDLMRNEEFGGHIKKNGRFLTKKEPKTYHELLNDKSHVSELKELYQGYGLIAEAADDNEYDDEPDDSYDSFAESEPKIHSHYHGKMKEMLPDSIELPESDVEEDEEEERPGASKNSPLDFCENPEAIRARREQQYQQRMGKRFPHRQPQPQQEAAKSRDVVGNQKGQGQSNDVLRNRQHKNTNKSSRANHNRKAGSSFKQSRGMY